ncbi:MAG: aminoglycoside phosphotransferase family protein [Bacteroidales bacterium]|nr:aminoglycoside phosphotransferase family protein [Bacteroidales bacterium]
MRYGNGHINNTYLVTTNNGKFILQQVNGNVFNIDNLVHNYQYLIEAVSAHGLSGKLFPDFMTDSSGFVHFIDTDETAWRKVKFIDHSSAYLTSPNISITEKAGAAMGKFQLFLTKLDPQNFKDTIPDFHNPECRLVEFNNALNNSDNLLNKTAEPEIKFALKNKSIALKISDIIKSGLLPVRITHNDTKLDNILFDNVNDHAYVIDLDTVMKGSILFDFGDMVRSITSGALEDEIDLSKVAFNLDHFEALCRGYLNKLKTVITPIEKANLLSGALSIIYVQGLRFLTDYLSGSSYYKIDYPNHNLIRCRTQFRLLEDILNNKDAASCLIDYTN